MRLFEIVPGATYTSGSNTRRVTAIDGVVTHTSRGDEFFFDDDHILYIQQGVQIGEFTGNPVRGAYRDLRNVTVSYLEEDYTVAKSCTIQEFAEWAKARVE